MDEGRARARRLAAVAGVVGPALFAGLVVVGGALDSTYSHVSQKISELGGQGAENPTMQNVNFLLLGVLLMVFAWALAQSPAASTIGAGLIGIFGASSGVANAALPCDAACKGETTVGLLHNVTGVIGFLAAIVGMVILARRWNRFPQWRSHARFTRIMVAVAVTGLGWFIATQALDAQTYAGVAQRSFVVALLAWIVVSATRLRRQLVVEVPSRVSTVRSMTRGRAAASSATSRSLPSGSNR